MKCVEKVIYQLNLSENLHIHNVFYVSLLHDHKLQLDEETSESEILHLTENSEMKKWEVEIIINLWVVNDLKNKPILQYWIV